MRLSQQQKRFAELYQVSGNAAASYEQAYGTTRAAAIKNAHRVLRRPQVQEYLAKLDEDARAFTDITREEILEHLLEIVHTPAGEIGPDSPLCQEYREEQTQHGTRTVVKIPSKIEALKEIVRICGFAKPEEVKHGVDDELGAILRAVTGVK